MSIPFYSPLKRTSLIERNLFPKNRKSIFYNKSRIANRKRLQTVFLFWLLLFVFTKFGFLYFHMLASRKRYSGLKVEVPFTAHIKHFSSKNIPIRIWVDRNQQCVINDRVVKNSKLLSEVLNSFKDKTKSDRVYFFADFKCKMGFIQIVFNEIYKTGFKKLIIVTSSSTSHL